MTTTWRGAVAAVAAMLCLLATACGGGSGKTIEEPDLPVGSPVLPDLMPVPPIDLQMTRLEDKWHVRFSSILVNVGDGDFVLRATREPGGTWSAEQDVPYSTSGAKRVPVDSPLAWGGDGHEHWHIVRVASVWLVPLDAKGRPVNDSRDRIDSKIGFCFYDHTHELDRGPAERVYSADSCGHEDDTELGMGLSPGWNDTYRFILPGQNIDVSGLRDGTYRLWSEVDERGWFRELTRDNNLTWVDFELSTKDGLRFAKVVDVGPEPA